jgi:hypothetical protein
MSDLVEMLQGPRFVPVTVFVALALLASWIGILAFPIAVFFLIPFFLPPLSIILGALVCVGFVSLCWRRQWGIVSGILTGLVIAILLSTVPTPWRSFSLWAADLVELAYYYDDLQRMADQSRRKGESPAIGVWVTFGFGSATRGLAIDPSGEIMLPANQRSAAWNAVGGQTELRFASMEARHIFGSYYIWSHD